MKSRTASVSAFALGAALVLAHGSCAGGGPATDVGSNPAETNAPCDAAARARASVSHLRAEGRLDRSLRVLAHADALCPGDAKQSEGARKELEAELQSKESPEALIELASRASTPADARRSYDRALAALERAGARVEVGTVVDAFEPSAIDNLELDVNGGRLAILQGNEVSVRDRRVAYRETLRILRDTSIEAAAFSGSDVLAIATKGETTLWNLASGALLQTLPTTGVHTQLAFSPDGRMLATTSRPDSGLVVFDTANGNVLHRLEGNGGFGFLPDGRLIVVVNGNILQAYDLATGKPQWAVDGASVFGSEGTLSVSKDGLRVRFAAGYGHVASIDIRSKKRADLTWESGVPDVPRILALSPDGENAVLGESTSPIPGGLHDVENQAPKSIPVDASHVETATFSQDGRVLALQTGREIHVVDLTKSNSLATLRSVYAESGAVAISHTGRHVALSHSDGAARLLSAEGGLTRLPLGELEAIALSADGKEIAAAREEPSREIVLFDARGTVKETLSGLSYVPKNLAFSPVDGRVLAPLAAVGAPGPPGSRFLQIPFPANAISRDGVRLALRSPSDVQIGDQKGALITRLRPREGDIRAAAFTPSNLLVMGMSNGMVVSDGSVQLKAHDESLSALAFASETRMASSAADGTVKIWDLSDPRNDPKVYRLPDVREIEASAGLFVWTSGDARAHLFHISSNRKATLVFPRDVDGGAIHIGDAVELLGAGAERAAEGLVCRVGQKTYPFALCRERFLTSGLLRALLSGGPVEFTP